MTFESLRQFYEARPFSPFVLHLADGRNIPVAHPEFMATAPSGEEAFVYQPDGTFNIVDLLLVTDLEVKPNGSHRAKKPR